MLPQERPTAQEVADAVRTPQDRLRCPGCRQPGFIARNSYYLLDGTHRRLRKCRFCGYARSETVPEAIPDTD